MEEKKKITIEVPKGKRAEWIDGVLTLVDEQPAENHISENITERIKTFEDACKWCAENGRNILNKQYMDVLEICDSESSDILAYLKLRIITCALNEGLEAKFEVEEKRWFPWFKFHTHKQLKKIPEGLLKKCGIYRVPRYFDDNDGVYGGFSYSHADHVSSYTGYNSRLTFKSCELAEYAGKQFFDIYALLYWDWRIRKVREG